MGMYTELCFASKLKRDVPQAIIDVLEYQINKGAPLPELPDHPFFKCARWQCLAWMDSAYFDGGPAPFFGKREYSDQYTIQIWCNLKNYDNEIEHFINWITPYLDRIETEYLGYVRYEETDVPTLIYHPDTFETPVIKGRA